MHMSGMSCGTGSRSSPSSLRQSALGVQDGSSTCPSAPLSCAVHPQLCWALKGSQAAAAPLYCPLAAAAVHPSSPYSQQLADCEHQVLGVVVPPKLMAMPELEPNVFAVDS